jgi:hypothetical protein
MRYSGASGAHIHCGASGVNGDVVAFLAQPVDGGLLTSPVQFSGVPMTQYCE